MEDRVYLVQHVVRPARDYPQGLVRLRRDDRGVRLTPLDASAPGRAWRATVAAVGRRAVRVEGPEILVELLDVGVADGERLDWLDAARQLVGHDVTLLRLPTGARAAVHVERLLPTPTGRELHVSRGGQRSVVPIKAAQLAAFYWDGARLELRGAHETGLVLWRSRCACCAAFVPAGDVVPIDDEEYCARCGPREQQRLAQERRRLAQLRVGVCRGCAFYARRFEAASLTGGEALELSECAHPGRVAEHGAYPAGVRACRYRVARARHEPRPETGTVGRARRDDGPRTGRAR